MDEEYLSLLQQLVRGDPPDGDAVNPLATGLTLVLFDMVLALGRGVGEGQRRDVLPLAGHR